MLLGYKVRFVSPFNDLMKDEIVKIGLELNVDYKNTWSCYKGEEKPCLKCGTCIERTEAFYLSNSKDPALSDVQWDIAVTEWEKAKQQHEANN